MQSQKIPIFDKLKQCANKQKINNKDVERLLDLTKNTDTKTKSDTLLLLRVWLDFGILTISDEHKEQITKQTKESAFLDKNV